ncbi:DEAD/DEAH box helicase [Sphaerisporangium corydalis]|uniref:DEAD/DEAH box helicase family protein n=1 Tax=Sphaerisporangium corydalis TaxID=1441875 RepID=A0ABV9EKD4_9ACTN|nr:DEAD/DEAH box helicase [Sphaerisporangium corydalis]
MADSVDKLSVIQVVIEQSQRVLRTYTVDPGLIQEHANSERRITQGGYGDRQVYELVQNGADELRDQAGGEIRVVLTPTHLYCANEGTPVTAAGADTILRMSVSRKRGGQIGRFGVGVKSVLSISDTPQFFSRDGESEFAFGFDRAWSTEQIKAVHSVAGETPVLRMAQVIDPAQARVSDPVLNELMRWATTVVRLPLQPESVGRLGIDLARFPLEFPLFSPHVGTLTLEDRRAGRPTLRQIFQRIDGTHRILQEIRPDEVSIDHQWRVFTRTHRPTDAALRAAGELHDRPEIDISWAVPSRARDRGILWAYFPTNYATTLRGILNAPWKTSEDRQNLFDRNAFNDELIKVSAELVVDSLPELTDPDDPATYIDLLPGRGREAPQWADKSLTSSIWAVAARKPSLPDQIGRLRTPETVKLHPAGLDESWLTLWSGYEGRPIDWCHHSIEKRERRARAERIIEQAKCRVSTIQEWLSALVSDGTAEASARAVRIVAEMHRAGNPMASEAVRTRILLTEDDGLVPPVRGKVFRRSGTDNLRDRMVYVHPDVLADQRTVQALESLGIQEADASGRFAAIIDQGFEAYNSRQWADFWQLARQAGPTRALTVLEEGEFDPSRVVKVRVMSGEWKAVRHCLLPGPVVPRDGSRDAAIALDLDFHADDLPLLKGLGLVDRPISDQDPRGEWWFNNYVEGAWKTYCKKLPPTASTPQLKSIQVDGANPPGPLHLLPELSNEGRAAFLGVLPEHGLVTAWTVRHGSQLATQTKVSSPLVWMARKHGYLSTSQGVVPVASCVGPQLATYRDLLPVARVSTTVGAALRLPSDLSGVPQVIWSKLVSCAATSEVEEFAGKVYALLFEAEATWPEDVPTRCRVGDEWSTDRPDGEIAVTSVRDEYDALVRERVPALLVPSAEAAEAMIQTWGMLRFSQVVEKEIRYVAQSEPVLLVDEFPHLKMNHRSQVTGWSLVRCGELDEVVRTPNGMRTQTLNEATQERSVLVLRPADDLAALMAVDRVLGLGLAEAGCRSVLKYREQQRDDERMRRARETQDPADKILLLVGEDALRRGLPQGLVEGEQTEKGRAPDAHRIAELALNAHGEAILRHHGKDLAARLPEAPTTFRGDSTARRFTSDLGLPESFAGTKAVPPPAEEIVDGPVDLPTLHPYQKQLADNMFRLLDRARPGRAMLTLPTGAGKTRVAVEAVINAIKAHSVMGPVLWIAQSRELCEQAVQSWRFLWSKVGPPKKRLTISRLWDGNSATPVTSNAHLVVAIDDSLKNRLRDEDYEWLRRAAVVIVDEAHSALAPTYTEIFRHLGLTYTKTERPLIGLTATPYRSTNEDQTRLLIDRFGSTRLDDGVFDGEPYEILQDQGVLARVEHRPLVGATISLTQEELKKADFRGLPASAEERLAADEERNSMLIKEIASLDPDWPVLLFAASVNHARLLVARLNDRRISSRVIESATPSSERARVIEDFRNRRIRVIANYGVLAQGFDAPATRAVVVARPTYSPNVYQQMIGRGLRGPKNGGNEVCLILDVQDNITNFGEKLAFTRFEHLWSKK